MKADDLRRHLDSWWRDRDFPEGVVRTAENVRVRLEADEISREEAAAELVRLSGAVDNPTLQGKLILAATQVAGNTNVREFKRRSP